MVFIHIPIVSMYGLFTHICHTNANKCKAIKYRGIHCNTYHTWILWDDSLSSSNLSFCWRSTHQNNGSWPSSRITPSNYEPNSPNIFCLAVQSDKKNVSPARFVRSGGQKFPISRISCASTLRISTQKSPERPYYIVYTESNESSNTVLKVCSTHFIYTPEN